MKAAYRLSSSKKKSFVRAEQQHEKLVRPWVKEHLRSTKESKSEDGGLVAKDGPGPPVQHFG